MWPEQAAQHAHAGPQVEGTPLQQMQRSALRLDAGLSSTGQDDAQTSESSGTCQMPLETREALLPKPIPDSYKHPFSPWMRRYMVGLVSLMTAMLCADQNLLAPNLSAAAAYFGLDDRQKDTYLGGYLMAAFFLVGAPAALVCGWLADKYNRIHLLVAIVFIGETPCLCTYWVTTLWQFFLVRMLTGIAVGGCFPLVFSLLGDLFPVNQRSAMAALIQIALGAGIGGGQLLAGLIGPATNWKVPFVVMAAPSLLLAIIMLVTAKEPPRGGFEEGLAGQLAAGAAYNETVTWSKVKQLLRIPSNWIIILQGLPGCLPWGVMQTYINDYLHLNKGYSVELSTVVILLFGVGCGVGVLAGGAAGQLLYNWKKESMAFLTGVSAIAGTAPVWAIINVNMSYGVCIVMAAVAGFLVSIAGPNTRAIIINVNAPETRGVAIALQSVTDDLGRGLGPVIVAGFITQLGRVGAFNISVGGWILCGVLLCFLALTIRKDEALMQKQLTQKSQATLQQIRVTGSSAGGGVELGQRLIQLPSKETPAARAAAVQWYSKGSSNSVAAYMHVSAHRGSISHDGTHAAVTAFVLDDDHADGHVKGAGVSSDPGVYEDSNAAADFHHSSSTEQLIELHSISSTREYEMQAAQTQLLPLSSQQELAPAAVLSSAGTRHRGGHLRSRSASGGSGDSGGSRGSRLGKGQGVPVAESIEGVGVHCGGCQQAEGPGAH